MITIAVSNQKGGVGKTVIAFNLSKMLSKRDKTKVLAVDNDPQGNLTSSFLEDPKKLRSTVLDAYSDKPLKPLEISENLHLIGADIDLSPVAEKNFQAVVFSLKEALNKISKTYNFAIIDCLPSFGNLHLASLIAADYVLIPVTPAPYSLSGLKELFETIRKVKKNLNPKLKILGIVINSSDGRKLIMENAIEELLHETYKRDVFKSKISKRVKVAESPTFHQSVAENDPNGPAAREFKAFVNEILKRIKSRQKNKR